MTTFVDNCLRGLNRRLRASARTWQTLSLEERNAIRRSVSDATALRFLADSAARRIGDVQADYHVLVALAKAGIIGEQPYANLSLELSVIVLMDLILFAPNPTDNCCIHLDRDAVVTLLDEALSDTDRREAADKVQQHRIVYLDFAEEAFEVSAGLSLRAAFLVVGNGILHCCAVLETHHNEHRVFICDFVDGQPVRNSVGYDSFHVDEFNEAHLLLNRPAVPSVPLNDELVQAGVDVRNIAFLICELAYRAVLSLVQVQPEEYQQVVDVPEVEGRRRRARRRNQQGTIQYIPIARLGPAMRRYARGPRRGFERRPLNFRFGVRRHQRWQACGRNREERRLIWIDAHQRGGEHLPLRQEAQRIPNPQRDEDV